MRKRQNNYGDESGSGVKNRNRQWCDRRRHHSKPGPDRARVCARERAGGRAGGRSGASLFQCVCD